jgi:hypothetical protein
MNLAPIIIIACFVHFHAGINAIAKRFHRNLICSSNVWYSSSIAVTAEIRTEPHEILAAMCGVLTHRENNICFVLLHLVSRFECGQHLFQLKMFLVRCGRKFGWSFGRCQFCRTSLALFFSQPCRCLSVLQSQTILHLVAAVFLPVQVPYAYAQQQDR